MEGTHTETLEERRDRLTREALAAAREANAGTRRCREASQAETKLDEALMWAERDTQTKRDAAGQ